MCLVHGAHFHDVIHRHNTDLLHASKINGRYVSGEMQRQNREKRNVRTKFRFTVLACTNLIFVRAICESMAYGTVELAGVYWGEEEAVAPHLPVAHTKHHVTGHI